MQISTKQLSDISEALQCGMRIFVNKETYEIREVLDWEDSFSDDSFWVEEMKIIEREWKDYAVITKMESYDAFKVMKEFADEVEDQQLQRVLINTLNRRSPFANFKAEVESSTHRQRWFDFRDARNIEYVKRQLEFEEIKFDGKVSP